MANNLKAENYIPVVRLNQGYYSKKDIRLGGSASFDMSASTGTFKAPSGATTLNGATTISSASANALSVGANGTTNPVLNIDDSTASVATGLNIKGAAAASGVAVTTLSSGTNEDLSISAKGAGTLNLNSVGGGFVAAHGVVGVAVDTATPAGGSTSARLLFGTTAGFGVYYGSGVPTVTAAQGSLYLRSDGSTTATRLYVNTNGSTTWTNFTSAA